MESEQIQVNQEWSKLKSIQDIQVFLGFANFYWQFIQGFSKIVTLLTSVLKITVLLQVLVTNKMLAVNEVGYVEDFEELIEKSGKLSKTRKFFKSGNSKGEKLSKFRKLTRLGKKLAKNGNSSNFNAKKDGPTFLTLKAKVVFNSL